MKTKLFAILALAALTLTVRAQTSTTTDANGNTTTTTGPTLGTASSTAPRDVIISPDGNLFADLGNLGSDLGVPTSITNYGGGIFYSKSFSNSKQWGIGALVVANVTQSGTVGFTAGVDRLFGGGKTDSANILSGGITLKQRIYPVRYLAKMFNSNLSTNSWFYKEGGTVFAADLVGKALGSTAAVGGGVANIVRGGINLDVWQFKSGLFISLAIDYGNRTGAGAYNGNWGDFLPNVHWRF